MKTKNRQFLAMSAALALTLSSAITSCKKDKDDSPKPMTATVNGTALTFSDVTGELSNGSIRIDGNVSNDTLSYIILSVPDTAKANSKYSFDNLYQYYYDSKKNKIFASFTSNSHGTLTVDNHDKSAKKISGKFEGVIYGWSPAGDSVVLKNGQFNLSYE